MSDSTMPSPGARPSKFTWKSLGDLQEGRPTLGFDMPVLVFRLFQYTLKDVLSQELGKERTQRFFRDAGRLAGLAFAQNVLDLSGDFDFFITNLQRSLRDLKIGILRVEQANPEDMTFIFTISEDLDCSGLPMTSEMVCCYDEGLIAGILEAYSGKAFTVQEVDCWANGGRTCRFNVTPA